MPVHVEEMNSQVTALSGDLPLSEEQFEALIERIMQRLEQREREGEWMREATSLGPSAAPPMYGDE